MGHGEKSGTAGPFDSSNGRKSRQNDRRAMGYGLTRGRRYNGASALRGYALRALWGRAETVVRRAESQLPTPGRPARGAPGAA